MASEDLDGNHFRGFPTTVTNFTKNTTEEDTRKAFNDWAPMYEQDVLASGYVAFNDVADTFDSSMTKCFGEQRKTMKILDVGTGTGLVGENLCGRGYTRIDALDISQEMLDIAKEKNIYNKLICAALCEEPVSEIATGEYDGLISAGLFSPGHAGPGGLKEIVRQVKSGGLISFSLRKECLDEEELGYAPVINKLIEDKKWEMISRDLTQQMPINSGVAERYKMAYIFMFKVV